MKSSAHVLIDPGRAVSWSDETTLRVGFERGNVLVSAPTPELQQLFRRLLTGIPEEEFNSIVESAETRKLGMHEIIDTLRPALVRRIPKRRVSQRYSPSQHLPPSSIRTTMSDDGREIPGLQTALETNWLCSFEKSSAAPELAVQVIRFLEPLERSSRWLYESVPHLLIRFTDEAVRVGPLVSANGSPCHSCEALHLVEKDPSLPGVAAQFYGKRPSSETAHVSLLVGALAAHYVHAWREGHTWVHNSQLVLPARHGTVSELPTLTRIEIHPECGCALSEEFQPH
ncbi:hypothetical protein [Leucobacter denitrificans]|uniref:TOMM leader peptide-binding protein n=1 Tax=Leucobacter denitrificans TaxID=683042 RepID=A0A7G9S4W7_9MICO|nr:hypothetical protein [Leucobacter denitrificans]QNN62892.1 hypothetical protein H9L06_00385 [Leucobacter denitrificans]